MFLFEGIPAVIFGVICWFYLTDRPREVMTVIYMDEDMRLAEPRNENQKADWEGWCPGAQVGELIRTPINPVLWSSRG